MLVSWPSRLPRFPVPDAADVLRARYTYRLPARLEGLVGLVQGTIDLPLPVVWSGRRSYELSGRRPGRPSTTERR
ncbi:hypothetical protein GCM10010278_66150 [Streptomyces melanogenes]|nr:hypothetical protein GCM10010278_66150 [Streptomyces melanogenes]